MSVEHIAAVLQGRVPTRVQRVVYDHNGQLDEVGDLLLWFGAEVVRLFSGRGVDPGDSDFVIAATTTPWIDPFAGSEVENAEYLRTHGRYKLTEVTTSPPYRELIGRRIDRVLPLFDPFGFSGVRLEVGDLAANIFDGGDEVVVSWGDDLPSSIKRAHE